MKEITIYSNTGCSKCAMLKRWLSMMELDYNELNISKDSNARDELIQSGRRSLPQVKIDSEFIDYNEYNDIADILGE